jgi:hypothetical protein
MEPIIPVREVKKAVFSPLNSNGILASRFCGSKLIRPRVIPANVPNTPNDEIIVGKLSIHLLFSIRWSLFFWEKK